MRPCSFTPFRLSYRPCSSAVKHPGSVRGINLAAEAVSPRTRAQSSHPRPIGVFPLSCTSTFPHSPKTTLCRKPGWRRKVAFQTAAQPSYPELEKMTAEEGKSGSEKLMKVTFRQVDTFSLWLWFELYKPATTSDMELLETVLESWFVLGRIGGFNSMNMQVSQEAPGEASFFRYDATQTDTAGQSVFMDYTNIEAQGLWCRFWVNMGTADEVALDVLINALSVFSRENLGIKQLIIGGANDDWPVPDKDDEMLSGLGEFERKDNR